MKAPACCAVVTALFLFAGNDVAHAVEKVAGFEAFRMMRTRNMFDPNRRPARSETPRTVAPVRENRSSSLSLTGTMVTEGKALAFFTGTRADYSKVVGVGDTIADGKITAIKSSAVELERAGKVSTLAIGQQFQIDGKPSDSPPAESTLPATADAPPVEPGAAAPAPAAGTTPAAPPASSTDKSEILRRMMERREKEMNK